MKISVETTRRLLASGRNYVNFGLGALTSIGIMTVAQQKQATDAINEIATGLGMVFSGATSLWAVLAVVLGPIITGVLSRWASNSASSTNQAASLKASAADPTNPALQVQAQAAILDAATSMPNAEVKGVIVTSSEVAQQVPSPKVVPQ